VILPPIETKPIRECVELPAYRCGRIQAVQQRLTELGYNPGPVNGEMGRKTHEALKRFQADKKLKKTGKIDTATLKALDFCCVKPTSAKFKAAAPKECRK